MQQLIKCETLTEFTKVSAMLVAEGVTFRARTKNLTIELTGGY